MVKEYSKSTPRDDKGMTAPRKRMPEDASVVDINDPEFLRRFVTEQGKILPIRISGLTSAQQRKLKTGVRRARNIGLSM